MDAPEDPGHDVPVVIVGGGPVGLSSVDFGVIDDEASQPGLLVLEQAETERLLIEAIHESGRCDLRFGTEAIGIEQDHEGVVVTLQHRETQRTVRAAYVVGCDGAGSFVRGACGWDFEGITYRMRPVLADVCIADDRDTLDSPRLHNGRGGMTAALRLRPGMWRIIRLERGHPEADDVPDSEVRGHVETVLGSGAAEVVWASRFRMHARHVDRFRLGRVLLAGDAHTCTARSGVRG